MQTTPGGPATPSNNSGPATPSNNYGPASSAKPALRQLYRDRRRQFVAGLVAGERETLDRALAGHAEPLARLPGPIASYAAVGDELDPRFVEQRLGPHGFPRIDGKALRFHLAPWEALVPGRLGIPEPLATAPEIQPQLLLVPLIAATLAGVRLGQGGGYYDRTLAALRARGPVIAVGIAWEVQVADTLPSEPHDALLDWLLTPQRLVECASSR